ncbi:MAG: HAD family hydrolase [Capsulimonadaceae bacterium]
MSSLRGVLLDIDGTLVDSNNAQAEAWRLAMSEYGIVQSLKIVGPFAGIGVSRLLPASIGVENYSVLGQVINRRRAEIFRTRFLPWIQPVEGAAELVGRLREANVTVIAVSSSNACEAESLLDAAGLANCIDFVSTASQACGGDPAVAIIRNACRLAGLASQSVVFVGETPCDHDVAVRAQVRFIGLRHAGWSENAFPAAVAIYDSPVDMFDRVELPKRRLVGAFA